MGQSEIASYVADWPNALIFKGQPDENVQLWICTIRLGLKQRHVPRELWVDVVFHFMGEEPRAVLAGIRETMENLGVEGSPGTTTWQWDWDTMTRALVHIQERAKKDSAESDSDSISESLRRLRREHPYATAAAGLGLITVGGIAVSPAILVGTLHLLGFGASGVVGGSIAAGVKALVFGGGVVARGSLFAMAQAAGAGGAAVSSSAATASAGAIGLGAWLFGTGESAPPVMSDDETPILLQDQRSDEISSGEEEPQRKPLISSTDRRSGRVASSEMPDDAIPILMHLQLM